MEMEENMLDSVEANKWLMLRILKSMGFKYKICYDGSKFLIECRGI
jgi:hypothetical protein